MAVDRECRLRPTFRQSEDEMCSCLLEHVPKMSFPTTGTAKVEYTEKPSDQLSEQSLVKCLTTFLPLFVSLGQWHAVISRLCLIELLFLFFSFICSPICCTINIERGTVTIADQCPLYFVATQPTVSIL